MKEVNKGRMEEFKESISLMRELVNQIEIGGYEISEEDRSVSPEVAKALDGDITNLNITGVDSGKRMRVNRDGMGAKADLIIMPNKMFKLAAGVSPNSELKKDEKVYRSIGEQSGVSLEEIYENKEMMKIVDIIIQALRAVVDINQLKKSIE